MTTTRPPTSAPRSAFDLACSLFVSDAQCGPAAVYVAARDLRNSGTASDETLQALSSLEEATEFSALQQPSDPTDEEICNRLRLRTSQHIPVSAHASSLHRSLRAMTMNTTAVDDTWLCHAAAVLRTSLIVWTSDPASDMYHVDDFSMYWGNCDVTSSVNVLKTDFDSYVHYKPLVPSQQAQNQEILQGNRAVTQAVPNDPSSTFIQSWNSGQIWSVYSMTQGRLQPNISAISGNIQWVPTHQDDQVVLIDNVEVQEYHEVRGPHRDFFAAPWQRSPQYEM